MDRRPRLMWLGTLWVGVLLLVACGPGGASSTKAVVGTSLAAEVCIEGEARDTVVYIKNLGDSEWQDIEFILEKGGETYMLGAEPQSMRPGRDKPTSWPPESVKAAEALTDSGEFTRRTGALWRGQAGTKKVERESSYQESMERLGSFSFLTSATINVGGPEPGQWSGEVIPCS
mgnify:CR=1 FL=1